MSSGWWSSQPGAGYLSLGQRSGAGGVVHDEPASPAGSRASFDTPDGWGIAYVSHGRGKDEISDSESVRISVPESRMSLGIVEGPFFARHSLEGAHGVSASRRASLAEHTSKLYAEAPPIQRWYRGLVAMVNMLLGTSCIQVGLREEDSSCAATFGSLLVVVGVVNLAQCALQCYLVVQRIGIEGEDPRWCTFLIEVVLWVFVLHQTLLESCQNRKLPEMASVYLAVSLCVWAVSGVMWGRVLHEAHQLRKEAAPAH